MTTLDVFESSGIMRSFFLFCMLSGVDSAINAKNVLTPKENSERIEKCGRFPLNGSSLANSSLGDVPWLYQLQIGLYFSKVAAISKKHVVASSDVVLHYSVGYPGWIHNDSVFDREEYCKRGNKYLEVPTDVIKNFSSINRFPVLQGYILNICDQSAWDYPMILVFSEAFQSFVCVADESTSISQKTDVYAYGYNETDRKMYPFPLNILKINESSIDLNMLERGYYSGPVVTVVGGRVTQIGIIPSLFYGDIRFSAEPIRKIEESLCTLFGICKKEPTEATTTGDPLTSISTANVAHSTSTDDATTSSVTPGQDYTSATHTDDATDRENSTTSSVTPELDYTSASSTDDATTSSFTPGLDYTTASHTADATDRKNTTTSSVTPKLDNDWDRGRVNVVTQVADYTDEIDVAYDEFMAEYEKMMKKEHERKAKNGRGGNKLLSIELCVLILTAHCLIY